jgi:hypothetical protein
MGRPLNKKYFGNRNVGAPSAADDGIGGKSVASITLNAVGSYTARPVITLTGAPDLVGGIAATATITSEVSSGVITTAGTGYSSNETIVLSTDGGSATALITAVNSSGAITGISFTNAPADRGSFEALPGVKVAATSGSGTGAEITLTFRAKAVVVVPGSGYKAITPTAAVNAGGVTFTSVNMTTPVNNSNPVGSGFNPDAGIIAYAYTGSSRKQADITKQVSTDRYKVNTTDTAGVPVIAKLKTDGAASAAGEMTIKATDSSGKTYYVQKLTSRNAAIVPYGATGHEFPLNADSTPQRVQWTLSSATANESVTIENG